MATKKFRAKAHQLRYRTKEHNGGRHPQCDTCCHYTERVYSATEQTHWLELRARDAVAFLCVRCWSELRRDDEDEA